MKPVQPPRQEPAEDPVVRPNAERTGRATKSNTLSTEATRHPQRDQPPSQEQHAPGREAE